MRATLALLLGGAVFTAFLVAQDPVHSAPLGLTVAAIQVAAGILVIRRRPAKSVVAGVVLAIQAFVVGAAGLLFFVFNVLPVGSMPLVGQAAAHPFDPWAFIVLLAASAVLVPLYVSAFRWISHPADSTLPG